MAEGYKETKATATPNVAKESRAPGAADHRGRRPLGEKHDPLVETPTPSTQDIELGPVAVEGSEGTLSDKQDSTEGVRRGDSPPPEGQRRDKENKTEGTQADRPGQEAGR